MDKIWCASNGGSNIGYAWWLMERFWEAIAHQYPGRVVMSYKVLRELPQRLVDAGVQFDVANLDTDTHSTLCDFVRRHRIAHVYLTDRPATNPLYARLRMAGVKSITVHDHTPGSRTPAGGMRRVLKAALARTPLTADACVAVSDLVLQRLRDVYCLPASRCHVARNGIDLDIQVTPTDIRAELGLPADAVMIVSCSRLTRYKRIDLIIRASEMTDGYYIHCGGGRREDGNDMNEFRAMIDNAGLQDRFFILGHRSDVAGVLASSDIAVHASQGEVGTSLSILEFMRAGLPAVVSDDPTVCQGIRTGLNGLTFAAGDASALAAQVNRLIASRELRHSLGAAARRDVAQYDIKHTVNTLLGVLKGLRI